MTTTDPEYSVEQEITHFLGATSATRSACDAYAKERLGNDIIPVAVQGVCSYTVYTGPSGEFIAQFRLKSLGQRMDTAELARTICGQFAPQVTFRGQIGEDVEGKEPLYIYIMNRIEGISYLDFLLANISHVPENSPQFSSWRKNLITDIAGFFALSWKSPLDVDQAYRDSLRCRYEEELGLLLTSLPDRFHPLIHKTLNSLLAIISLPTGLLHKDFGVCNIMVDESSCNLVGVIDWAEAETAPFGLNLHSHQRLISKIHLKNGWSRYDDYNDLEEVFWNAFSREIGGLDNETSRTIRSARILGTLLSCGFTSRLANMPKPIPIENDESRAYKMRDLDGLLVNPATRYTDLALFESDI